LRARPAKGEPAPSPTRCMSMDAYAAGGKPVGAIEEHPFVAEFARDKCTLVLVRSFPLADREFNANGASGTSRETSNESEGGGLVGPFGQHRRIREASKRIEADTTVTNPSDRLRVDRSLSEPREGADRRL